MFFIIDDKDRVTGKRKRVWHSFRGSRTEAKVEARRLLADKDAGKRVDPNKITVAAFLAWFGGTGYLLTRFSTVWFVFGLFIAIASGLGELRNGLVVRASDAVIAVGGEFGTLSEIGFALKLGKRVVGLGTWELSRRTDAILRAATAEDAVRLALAEAP